VTAAAPASPVAPPRPGWLVLGGFLVAGSLLGLLGRATVIEGTELAAVWPAAGVGVLWLLVRQAGPVSIDTALMASVMFGLGVVTGLPVGMAALLSVAHTAQAVVIAVMMRRTLPELWGCGGTHAIDSPRRLARYLACVSTGVLVGLVIGVSGWRLEGASGHPTDALLWFGRNTAGILVIATAGLLLFQYLAQQRPRARVWEGSLAELGAAWAVSAGLYVLVFIADVPSTLFLLLGVVIWFGVRFGTLMVSLHTLVLSLVAVLATLQSSGPFAHESPVMNALLVQLFVIATACTGMALSTGLDERRALSAEMRAASVEMTYQTQLLNAVVNSMAEGLAVVDETGEWVLRNPAAARVGGLAGDLREQLSTALGDEDPVTLALAGETVRDRELRVAYPPGEGRILAVSAAPLPPDAVTGRARALLIFRDATVEHARRVDLTAFAAVVAHDLRNPLAGLESWTEMVATELGEDGEVDAELVRSYVDRVGTGTRRMTDLIEDLLDRATSESALRLRRVDMTALAKEVAADHGANGHISISEIPEVHADPALVRQVIDNLFGNALKFVRRGIPPRVSVSGWRTDSGTVAISVADEGIGLPPGTHERVFEEYHRAHPTFEGRGLGLAICRRIVERHGGAISARDNLAGPGAVFEFTLPAPD
jgi:signal transduction histidine kinase/integral membrane sensor domain MASE1